MVTRSDESRRVVDYSLATIAVVIPPTSSSFIKVRLVSVKGTGCSQVKLFSRRPIIVVLAILPAAEITDICSRTMSSG